jgi:hypothetical protein
MYDAADRLYVRRMSSSALDVVRMITRMARNRASCFSSRKASRPSLRGMFRSRRMMPGQGELAGSAYLPRRCR